jgi:RimJ/RimL family protein N-acetyltransferase
MREDGYPIFELYAQDKEVTKFLTWEPHNSISDTQVFLKRCEDCWRRGTAFPWTIIRKSDKQLLGMVEITGIDQSGVNVGFVLARSYWGEGYVVESLLKIIAWAFSQEDIYRVWAICDVENTASARVMQKAGMQNEGRLRRWIRLPSFGNTPRDCYCYSIVR